MMAPKRVKFRKMMKGRLKGHASSGNTVAFGHFGLMALEPGWVTNRQIEAARVALTREMKRGGKVWIRIFPDKPITKKPAEPPRRWRFRFSSASGGATSRASQRRCSRGRRNDRDGSGPRAPQDARRHRGERQDVEDRGGVTHPALRACDVQQADHAQQAR